MVPSDAIGASALVTVLGFLIALVASAVALLVYRMSVRRFMML